MPKKEKKTNVEQNLEESFKKITTSFSSDLNDVFLGFSKNLENTINNISFGGLSKSIVEQIENATNKIEYSGLSEGIVEQIENATNKIESSGLSESIVDQIKDATNKIESSGLSESIVGQIEKATNKIESSGLSESIAGKIKNNTNKVESGKKLESSVIEQGANKLSSKKENTGIGKNVGSGIGMAIGGPVGAELGSVIGEMLEKVVTHFISDMSSAITSLYETFSGFLKDLGMKSLIEPVEEAFKHLISGNIVQSVASIIIGAYKIAFEALKKLNDTAEIISKGLGIGFNKAFGIVEGRLVSLQSRLSNLGMNIKELAEVYVGIGNSFDTTDISDEFIKDISLISLQTGLAGENASEFVNKMQGVTGASREAAVNASSMLISYGKATKTPLKKLFESVAKSSESMAKYSGKFFENNMRAAVLAMKMGSSFDSLSKTAEGLLNIEDTISKQYELSVLIGEDIDLSTAIYHSVTGNLEGVQSEILRLIKDEKTWNNYNTLQRRAWSETLKMSEEEIGRIVARKEEQATIEEQLLKNSNQMNNNIESLSKSIESVKSFMDIISAIVEQISFKILKLLFPGSSGGDVFSFIISTLNDISAWLDTEEAAEWFKVIRDAVAYVIDSIKNLLQSFSQDSGSMQEGFLNGFKLVVDLIVGTISFIISFVNLIKDTFLFTSEYFDIIKAVFTILNFAIAVFLKSLGGIWDILVGIFTLDFKLIGQGIIQFLLSPFEALYDVLLGILSVFNKFELISDDTYKKFKDFDLSNFTLDLFGIGDDNDEEQKHEDVDDAILDPHGNLMEYQKGSIRFNKNDSIVAGTNLFDGGNSNNNELLDLIKEQNKLLKEISEKEKNLPQLIVKNNVSGTRVELEKFNNKIEENVGGKNNIIYPYGLVGL